jgi:hypothetical protein
MNFIIKLLLLIVLIPMALYALFWILVGLGIIAAVLSV